MQQQSSESYSSSGESLSLQDFYEKLGPYLEDLAERIQGLPGAVVDEEQGEISAKAALPGPGDKTVQMWHGMSTGLRVYIKQSPIDGPSYFLDAKNPPTATGDPPSRFDPSQPYSVGIQLSNVRGEPKGMVGMMGWYYPDDEQNTQLHWVQGVPPEDVPTAARGRLDDLKKTIFPDKASAPPPESPQSSKPTQGSSGIVLHWDD